MIGWQLFLPERSVNSTALPQLACLMDMDVRVAIVPNKIIK